MSETVGDFVVERLHSWGVRKVFGYPGDGINGVFGALNRAPRSLSARSTPSRRFSGAL
jgi:pyruvate dehydrogenase (quinone)